MYVYMAISHNIFARAFLWKEMLGSIVGVL